MHVELGPMGSDTLTVWKWLWNESALQNKLEALKERRPPWPRQIITLILPTVKMLSLGCERLPTP